MVKFFVFLTTALGAACSPVLIEKAAAQTAPVEGGAFGLEAGQPISSLKILKNVEKNVYVVTVPRPNREFETYIAFATNKHGLCKIFAAGKSYENDRYGSETQSVFSKFKSVLIQKYGKSKDYDFLKYGALWKDSNEWVMSLKQNERSLESFWSRSEVIPWPNSLKNINLSAKATSSDSSYITLAYEFTNFEKCKSDDSQLENSGL